MAKSERGDSKAKKVPVINSCKENKKTICWNADKNIKRKTVVSTDSIGFLEINIGSELTFNDNVSSLCKNASQQLNSLYRLNKY